MSNLTYLGLVNQVLTGLREDPVTTVAATSYSSLIGKWINDAKRQVEDAWDWQCLSASTFFNIIPNKLSYDLVNDAGISTVTSYHKNPDGVTVLLTERARMRYDVMVPTRPMAFDLTTITPMQLIEYPVDWILRTLFIQPTALTQSQPLFFGLDKVGRSIVVTLFETPIQVRNWRMEWCLPQEDLANDSDTMLVPWYPVTAIALDIAMNERGEEVGEPGETVMMRAQTHIDNAVSQDSRNQPHKYTFTVA